MCFPVLLSNADVNTRQAMLSRTRQQCVNTTHVRMRMYKCRSTHKNSLYPSELDHFALLLLLLPRLSVFGILFREKENNVKSPKICQMPPLIPLASCVPCFSADPFVSFPFFPSPPPMATPTAGTPFSSEERRFLEKSKFSLPISPMGLVISHLSSPFASLSCLWNVLCCSSSMVGRDILRLPYPCWLPPLTKEKRFLDKGINKRSVKKYDFFLYSSPHACSASLMVARLLSDSA